MEKTESSHHSPTLHHPSAHDGVKGEELPQSEHSMVDRTVWRKLDMLVLPVFMGYFLFTILDKGNIGNARVAGLQKSLAMSDSQYTMALAATYVSGVVVQLPCNLLVKHVGPNIMLPTMIITGGLISASQGLVHNYQGFLACRLLFGFLQGGIYPVIFLCLSLFYPPKLLQRRIAVLYCLALLALAFSSLLAAAIVRMDGVGDKPGWAWIFIMEGLFAIAFGAISIFFLPRSPEKVSFLTETERKYLVSTLARTSLASEYGEKDSSIWMEVTKGIKSPHVWLLSIIFLFNGAMELGFGFFLPTIVAGLGHAGSQVQLMSAAPFAVAFILVIVSVAVSDHYQRYGCIVILFALFKIIGFTIYLVSSSNMVSYGSLLLSVPGAFSGSPALLTWLANNSAPHTRRATALAIIFILFELGGLFSLFLLGYLSTDPKHTTATITFNVMSIGTFILATANWIYLRRENRLKAEKRQNMRKEDEPEGAGDRSAWFVYVL